MDELDGNATASKPKCTIAIPVYNRERLIRHAVESALRQSTPGLEILVVDNCSTDTTWDVLQTYRDDRLRIVRNVTNVGLFGNFNRCLNLARGEYLRFLCSDDRLLPDGLTSEIRMMDRHPEAVLLSTHAKRIDADLQANGTFANHLPPGIYRGDDLIAHVLWVLSHYLANPLNYPSGILLRRDAALRAGEFDSSLRLVGDLDYFMRILTQGDGILINEIGCEIMMHDGQAGEGIMADGGYLEEWFMLADRWASQLQRQGIQRRVWEQLGADSIWAWTHFMRRGRQHTARIYWRTAMTKGLSPAALIRASIRLVWLQFLLRTRNSRRQPRLTVLPLD